jgi:polyhydroxyalkanoate synthase
MKRARIVQAAHLTSQYVDVGQQVVLEKEWLCVDALGGPVSILRKRLPKTKTRATVLLLHGFGQNRYSWHLSTRSFVNYLAVAGYDVYNVELRGHGRSRLLGAAASFSFESYALEDTAAAIEAVCAHSQEKQIFVIGHSLGGACLYACTPLLASMVRGIVTFCGVFDYGQGIPVIRALSGLAPHVLPSQRALDTGILARIMLPVLPAAQAALRIAQLLPWEPGSFEKPVLAEYLQHAFDRSSFDVLQEILSWTSQRHFQQRYAEAFWKLNKPLLVIAANRDLFNAAAGVKPAFDGSQSKDKRYWELSPLTAGGNYGHVDPLIGRLAPRYVWPVVRQWLDRR